MEAGRCFCNYRATRRLTFRAATSKQSLPLRQTNRLASAQCRHATVRVAAQTTVTSAPYEVRSFLLKQGWERTWADAVEERMVRRQLQTTIQNCTQVVDFFKSLGLSLDTIQNICHIGYQTLGMDVERQLRPVVQYLRDRGVRDIGAVLLAHPKLFDYSVDGKVLKRGRARVQVDVYDERQGAQRVNVQYFRDNTAFATAPVAPIPPKSN